MAGVGRPVLPVHPAAEPAPFILLGFVLAATMVTYFYAISKIQVAAAILLQYQSPVLVAAYALAFRRERHSPATGLAIVGSGIGCYLAVGAYSLDLLSLNREGIIGGLGAAAFLSGYTVLSESALRRHRPWTVLFYASLFSAAACNFLPAPFEGLTRSYDALQWFWILFISIAGTAVSLGLYNKGLRLIRATHASITATLQPIAAAVLAFLFLGEAMSPWQIVGVLVVVASVSLLQIGRGSRGGVTTPARERAFLPSRTPSPRGVPGLRWIPTGAGSSARRPSPHCCGGAFRAADVTRMFVSRGSETLICVSG
jgi:drug/metabolite transporter (DMT)-like permease